MHHAAALARRAPALLSLWLLPLLLLPLAEPLRLCNSWNVHGARWKLRDYPSQAGPVRISGQSNFSDCFSVTLNFSVTALSNGGPPIYRYLVWMDGYPASADIRCEITWGILMESLQASAPNDWSDALNTNQPTKRNYTFMGGWYTCCNTSDRCNTILQPPIFQINATPTPISSCLAYNNRGGYRFYSNPLYATPLSVVGGQYSACYSFTIELVREEKVLYYVKMDGYDPNLYDGVSTCMDWVNRTLLSLLSDAVFPIKFNLSMANSWGQCCNETNCNTVVLPPSSSARMLLPSLLHLGCMLVWVFMLILSLA